jgi:hypothetical protein
MKKKVSARHRAQLEAAQPTAEQPQKCPPPDGFRVRKVAQRGDGSIIAVQSVPTGRARSAPVPEGHEVAGVSTLFGADGKVVGQWVKTKVAAAPAGFDLLDAATRFLARPDLLAAIPKVPPPAPDRDAEDRMNMFVWGDPHIGLLAHARETGDNFDLKIACSDLRRSAELLVQRAPRARTATFVEVGDLWHAQDDTQRTPRGQNKLDVDGRRAKILDEGLRTVVHMIRTLLSTHEEVNVVLVPGNHDPDMAIITRALLSAVFAAEPRIKILDNADPWIYLPFGKNLFLFNHGDKKAKPQELGEIMLADRPEWTGAATNRYALTGHVHHKNRAEFRWGWWESFNSLCAQDFWHRGEGYRSKRLVEAITYHREWGEQQRRTLSLAELRSAP